MITDITSTDHFKQIISQDSVCVVDYHADWSGPARAILPTFAKLSEVYSKLNFYKVDVDEHAQLTQMAGARVYPTIIVYRGGTKLDTISGADPGGLTTLVKSAVRCA
jgi:thioredoxin 1